MSLQKNSNQFYKLPILDGMELLDAQNCTIDFPFHQHETYNISLILKNTFSTRLQNKQVKAPVGSLSITNANELHANPCDRTIGNTFFTYYIPPDVINQFAKDKKVFFEDKVIHDQKLFDELFILSQSLKMDASAFEQRLLKALNSLVSAYTIEQEDLDDDFKVIQHLIDESFVFEGFSLTKISAKFGINKYKLIRLFKQETGLTPYNYILSKRIEKSKELLKHGMPIPRVAITCGFYDTPHFYKYFKRFTGVNPMVFQSAFE